MKVHSLVDNILSLLYPSFCVICGNKTDNPYSLCKNCKTEIKNIERPFCRICGKPLVSSNISICGECIKNPPPFKMARAGYLYEGVLKEVIHNWKYKGKRSFSRLLSSLLLKAILKSDVPIGSIDMIVYVPVSKKTLKNRGFNQVKDMAVYISQRLKIPLYKNLRKKFNIMDQTFLSKKERIKNVKGAFYLSDPLPDTTENILILDDVYTTGATVREISRVFLSENDNLNVYIFTLSRGVI